jgi:hypothetical protein
MSLRKAKLELQKLKKAVEKPLPNGGIVIVHASRETNEQALERLGIDPETEGLVFIQMSDEDLRLA